MVKYEKDTITYYKNSDGDNIAVIDKKHDILYLNEQFYYYLKYISHFGDDDMFDVLRLTLGEHFKSTKRRIGFKLGPDHI